MGIEWSIAISLMRDACVLDDMTLVIVHLMNWQIISAPVRVSTTTNQVLEVHGE